MTERREGAIAERAIPDAGDALGDDDLLQGVAVGEGADGDLPQGRGQGHTFQAGAVVKGEPAQGGHAAAQIRAGQAFTAAEGVAPMLVTLSGHSDCGQAGEGKGLLADAGDAVGDGDLGQAAAAVERVFGDLRQVPAQLDAGQTAIAEGEPPYGGDAVRDDNAGQGGAEVKGVFADGGDGVGDGHGRQAGAAVKGAVSDGGDRHAVDLLGDDRLGDGFVGSR